MPDMRGTGRNHAFDGKYKIASYSHTISPGVGFKTELDLIPIEMSAPWGGEQDGGGDGGGSGGGGPVITPGAGGGA